MRILHVFRSPVGGLFRHVRDLARGQSELGHDVGIFCDNSSGGDYALQQLKSIEPFCKLGIHREAMSKLPGLGDIACASRTYKLARALKVDVIHGHGAKGGLYARIAGKMGNKNAFYTPHGGSLHYDWGKFPGPVFLGTEWLLRKTNSAMIFVCEYEKQLFRAKIGLGKCRSIVVHNGLWDEEFQQKPLAAAAKDLLFVGEMRKLKGVDVLLNAIAQLKPRRLVTCCFVGEGADVESFKLLANELGVADQVTFVGRKTMNDALEFGRVFVLPSRNESFPYVMLEAAAAHKPLIASDIGGIAEVVPKAQLCIPGDALSLALLISNTLDQPQKSQVLADLLASELRQKFSARGMAEKITTFYGNPL
jgi:glycosyltransferase involved in cell wall biosynthesis